MVDGLLEVKQEELRLLRGLLDGLGETGKVAGYYAINRSLITARKKAGQLISSKYHIAATTVREKFRIHKASGVNAVGSMKGQEDAGLSMIHFSRTKIVPSTRKGRFPRVGVPVKIRKDKPKHAEPGAFITRANNATQMFRRTGKKRWPIEKVIGPSPLQLLSAVGFSGELSETIEESMEKNLLHIYRYKLRQKGLHI